MKFNYKNFSIIILSLALVFSLFVFSSSLMAQSELSFTPGTYTAVTDGHNGDLTLEVEFSKNEILSVKITEHVESAGISDTPIERIPAMIVENQTLAVDTVSGATVTSEAILTAVSDCVKQAGGDVKYLKQKQVSQTTNSKETVLETDIVVVGAGGTGLSAAASAHQNGADVIVLEKLATIGGSTGLSGGGISATGTKFQEERGIEDNKGSWMELWIQRQARSNESGIYPDYSRLGKFMDAAIVTTEWLADYVGHVYGAVTGFGLDPAERLHFPKDGGGAKLIQNIADFLNEEGVEILTETPATELILNDNGEVTGVIAENRDGKVTINAKKVILATGGYASSNEMLEKHIPELAGSADLTAATPGATGDGIKMSKKVNAALYEEPWVIGLGVATKIQGTYSLMMDWTKLYVNEEGKRFTNEQVHYAIATNKVAEQNTPWVIFDSKESNTSLIDAIKAANSTKEAVSADSITSLAEKMNVSEESFVNTINTYNKGVETGKDKLGKDADYLVSINKSPFYAIKLYPKTMGTFAGVKTNDNYQVLDKEGNIVKNLYAGGEMANKVLYNQVYMSGSAVQFALTSGRIAGEHAAKEIE